MKKEQFEKETKGYGNGTFIHLEYKSEKKKKGATITKISNGTYTLGKKASAVLKRDTQPLAKGHWVSDKLIECEDNNGNPYYKLRIYTSKNKKHKTVTEYYLDGKPTTKQELYDLGYYTDSDMAHRDIDMFDIMLDNLIKVGN